MLQRTPEWFQARVGKVTASRMHDVMAEGKKKKDGTHEEASTRRNYRSELVLECLYGSPQESGFMSFAMQQGIEKEASARDAYAMEKGVDVAEVGFIVHPTIAETGASPDGLVGSDGVLEIKCPEANAMRDMLAKEPVDRKYIHQVQWAMACTQRKWADLAFYRQGCPLDRTAAET